MLKVIECKETNDNLVYVGFENGLSRLFHKENFMETIKEESFYSELDKGSKMTIALGYACITGQLSFK